MSLLNKKKDMTPFDMTEKPVKQFLPLTWLLWGASFLVTRRMSVEKIGMKGIKPPFLVLSTHQGFSDYFIVPRLLFPLRANYISDMEGFAAYGKMMYKLGGCIGKRRYVPDVSVIKNNAFSNRCVNVVNSLTTEITNARKSIQSSEQETIQQLAK